MHRALTWTVMANIFAHVTLIWNIAHYCDVIMSALASQITSISIVCSTICSGADQWKHQSSASLPFVQRIHRWPVNSPHKGPVTRKMFPFDDVIMNFSLEDSTWDIIVKPSLMGEGVSFIFVFEHFELEDSPLCLNDYLQLYEPVGKQCINVVFFLLEMAFPGGWECHAISFLSMKIRQWKMLA